jgi:hypothetical protein
MVYKYGILSYICKSFISMELLDVTLAEFSVEY